MLCRGTVKADNSAEKRAMARLVVRVRDVSDEEAQREGLEEIVQLFYTTLSISPTGSSAG